MADRERVNAGEAVLEVAPAEGGCITRFCLDGLDILRPAGPAPGNPRASDPRDSACFPLVPYSGRIRDGRFSFAGEAIAEALNFAPSPHAIHGHGWQRAWRVEQRSDSALSIAYDYPATDGHWPYAYHASQRFALTETEHGVRLSVTIAARNNSDRNMPVGLGLHPYFPRTAGARIRARVATLWEMDAEVMPVAQHPMDSAHPLLDAAGLSPEATPMDNAFGGYAGEAEVWWQDRDVAVRMRSQPELGVLVVYTPPGESYFCVEPVSHSTDAFNAAAAGDTDTGMRVIAAGETFSTVVHFDASRRTAT